MSAFQCGQNTTMLQLTLVADRLAPTVPQTSWVNKEGVANALLEAPARSLQ